ncbi:hypothetical protein ACTMU2_04880 [Cupriavidus basilensis]
MSSALATRLRTWRDQPACLDVERALAGTTGATPRRAAVLTHLRDRLFDLSRRNRLLHFRPTAASVNVTVASVPLMLQIESVRPEHICTWGGPFAADLVAGKPVPLQRWLRFDDQPYLQASARPPDRRDAPRPRRVRLSATCASWWRSCAGTT